MLIDKIAYASELRRIAPLVKVLTACACILMCLLSDSYVLCIFLICSSIFTVNFFGKTKMSDILHLMTIPMSFVVMGCVAILITFSTDNTAMMCSLKAGNFYIGITAKTLLLCIKTASKTFACVSCMYFLSLTTPMNDLFGLLRRSFIPDWFVEIAELIYRYIFVLYDAASRIELAQKTRLGYISLKTSYKSVAMLITSVFIRAYRQADKTYTALEARGYTGSLATVNKRDEVKTIHLLVMMIYVAISCVIAILF